MVYCTKQFVVGFGEPVKVTGWILSHSMSANGLHATEGVHSETRTLVVIVLAVVMATSAFSQSAVAHSRGTMSLGGAFVGLSQNYSTYSGTQRLVLTGPGVQVNFIFGNKLGILMMADVGFATYGADNGTTANLSGYSSKIIADMIIGPVYRISAAKRLGIMVGGGAHLSLAFVHAAASSFYDYFEWISPVMGLAAVVRADFILARPVGVYLMVTGCYDLFAVSNYLATMTYKGGLFYTVGAGIEIFR